LARVGQRPGPRPDSSLLPTKRRVACSSIFMWAWGGHRRSRRCTMRCDGRSPTASSSPTGSAPPADTSVGSSALHRSVGHDNSIGSMFLCSLSVAPRTRGPSREASNSRASGCGGGVVPKIVGLMGWGSWGVCVGVGGLERPFISRRALPSVSLPAAPSRRSRLRGSYGRSRTHAEAGRPIRHPEFSSRAFHRDPFWVHRVGAVVDFDSTLRRTGPAPSPTKANGRTPPDDSNRAPKPVTPSRASMEPGKRICRPAPRFHHRRRNPDCADRHVAMSTRSYASQYAGRRRRTAPSGPASAPPRDGVGRIVTGACCEACVG